MAIVIISSWAEEARRELARAVATKLGCPSLSREELVEQATEAGIPVGKLEIAVMKGSAPRERLARHKSRYLAFITASVAEKARETQDLVYHGRACHLLLPGVDHVLRVGVVPHQERQLAAVMARLNLDRDKAQRYLADLSQDLRNWFHFMHDADPDEPGQYDLTLNLGHLSPESAASAVCSMAQLPDFAPTPASRRALNDLWLSAKARDRLGRECEVDYTLNITFCLGWKSNHIIELEAFYTDFCRLSGGLKHLFLNDAFADNLAEAFRSDLRRHSQGACAAFHQGLQ
jgi:hypothetical protein